jgi:hypothetical protein
MARQSKRDELSERLEAKADEARATRKANAGKATEAKVVADVKRIADDEDNPFPGTCSRDRFRRFGHFSESVVYDLFGNHSELQREAGLRDMRSTTAFRNRRAKLKTEERIQEYFKREVMPWAGKFTKKAKGKGPKRLIVGSDFHAHHVDQFALSVFLDVIKRVQPEYIALNGDVYDFPTVGKWAQPPNKLLNLQDELDFTYKKILKPVRKAAPDADISLVIGNHEYRLIRFLADAAPGLASLRCLSFSKLLRLDELCMSLVVNDSLLAPNAKEQKRAYMENWRVYEDCFVVTHGTAAGKDVALKELDRWRMSGTSGHVHRPQIISRPTLGNAHAVWIVTGMMADKSHGREFVRGFNDWTKGFAVITLADGVAFPQPVIVQDGKAEYAGHFYRER